MKIRIFRVDLVHPGMVCLCNETGNETGQILIFIRMTKPLIQKKIHEIEQQTFNIFAHHVALEGKEFNLYGND